MGISILNQCLSLEAFVNYLQAYNFGTLPANKLVVHHTWRPTVDQWQGQRSINGLKNYYEGKGWPAGPHLFIAQDGIWLFSPMRQDGIHASSLNHRSIGIEVVGDYDLVQWSGLIKYHAMGAIQALMQRLQIDTGQIYFHRDVSSKSCPGKAITKAWLLAELAHFKKDQSLEAIENLSASIPPISTREIMIPVWAAEAVAFVKKYELFEIQNSQDIRDAVKFHRLYQLIQQNHAAE